MNAARKLVFGETWFLPLGIAVVILVAGLIVRPLAPVLWRHAGGLIVLAGVIAVLVLSVARSVPRG